MHEGTVVADKHALQSGYLLAAESSMSIEYELHGPDRSKLYLPTYSRVSVVAVFRLHGLLVSLVADTYDRLGCMI